MTVQRPTWLQNVGNVYTAEEMRRDNKAMANRRDGVNSVGDYAVSQNGTPNMTVNVAAGEAYVNGSETATQGRYYVFNDAVVNRTIAASDPTNPRRDLVVVRVRDQFYSGTFNDADVIVVTGTPAPAPVDPTPPANFLVLARVAVAALAASITNANITDLRVWQAQRLFPGPQGLHVRDSTDARDNLALDNNGFMIMGGAISVPPAFGSALPASSYGTLPVKFDEQTINAGASFNLATVPTWARLIEIIWRARSGVNAQTDTLGLQFNGDVGASSYDHSRGTLGPTYANGGAFVGNQIVIADVPAATSSAPSWASGTIRVLFPAITTNERVVEGWATRHDAGITIAPQIAAGNWRNTATAINTIAVLVGTGPFNQSTFVAYAYP